MKLLLSLKIHNKLLKHRTFGAGQFVSRSFVALLCKNNPKNHGLKTAVVRGVKKNTMKKIILTLSTVFSITFSACGYSCPIILGEWQSSKELSYEYAKSAEGITENQLEFISQAFGYLKFTYYPKYALQHATPEFPIIINGKNHPMYFKETHQKVKYLKCTKELVVVKLITGKKEFEIMELHFVNENTFWVSSGSKIREYFIRNKEHA